MTDGRRRWWQFVVAVERVKYRGVCAQRLSRDLLHNLDMIPEPTNARQCVEVYGTHTEYCPHVSASNMAIFSEVHYRG